jgi:hypothetical protein
MPVSRQRSQGKSGFRLYRQTSRTGNRLRIRRHVSCFAFFLLSDKGVVLFEAVCGTLEKLGQKTAQVLGVLEPLSDEVKQEPIDVHRIQQMARELDFQAAKRERRGGSMEPLFDLGRVVVSEGARNALTDLEVAMLLARHNWGDWGDVNKHDWKVNEDSLRESARLLSVYEVKGTRFWVLTEADRSVTTVLLPVEHLIYSTDEQRGAARSAAQARRGYAELVRK